MKLFHRLLPLFLCLMAVGRTFAVVITFDDLHGSGYLPANYAGLTWGPAWQYFDAAQSPYTPASGAERIFSYTFGGFINFGTQVTFQGSWLASADVGQQMWWEGYQNGVKIFESQHYAGGSALFINLNWAGVDSVKLVDTSENHFILDNITYAPISEVTDVPDSTWTAWLLGLSFLALLAGHYSLRRPVRAV